MRFWGKFSTWMKLPYAQLGRWGTFALFLVPLIYALLGSLVFAKQDDRAGRSVEELGFGYGVLIQSLNETGEFRVCDVHHEGVCFSAHRLPLVPYTLKWSAALLGDDQLRITVVKSLFFALFLSVTLLIVVTNSSTTVGWLVGGALGMMLMPRWALTFFELGIEEAYLLVPFGLLFASILYAPITWWKQAKSGWYLGIGLAGIFLLKNSMPFLCFAAPFLIWWRYKNTKPALISLGWVVVSAIGLGYFNYENSGRWTIGSSWAGWNLYKGNNSQTMDYYPERSLDQMDYDGVIQFHESPTNEWEYDRVLKQFAADFVSAHPQEFLQLCLLKGWVFFGEVRPTGASRGEHKSPSVGKRLQMVWMIGFRGLFLVTVFGTLAKVNFKVLESAGTQIAFIAFLMLGLYSGFYVIGFAYERHVMPIVFPTLLLFWWHRSRPAANDPPSLST